tara:strand:- start:60 stop:650 length:591 start_codon:yes stop_codon:yes gene_type:complete
MITKLERRIEEKLVFPNSEKGKYLNKFFSDGFEYIFPSRQITSIYYENINFDIYKDSLEGVVPRKKIRIREKFDNLYLEEKIKLPDGKYKTSKKINDIPNVIHDKSYGIVKKICKITYSRSYLSNGKIRLTLDSDLKFENLINRYVFNMNNNIILEYKILDDFSSSENYINSHKELNSFKFSKYEQAISKVINFKV